MENPDTKKMNISETAKRFFSTLLIATASAILVKVLLPIPMAFTFSLIVFVFVLDTLLRELEKDSPTKRFMKRITTVGMGVFLFVGIRIAAGYFFDMPFSETHRELGKYGGLVGSASNNLDGSRYLILEILFVLPGAGLAYMFVKGGKTAKALIYIFSVLAFGLVLYQVKQANHAMAFKRNMQADINLSARNQNDEALKSEAAAASSYGVAKIPVANFYQKVFDEKSEFAGFIPATGIGILPCGTQVLQASANEKAVIFEGQAFTEVIMADKTTGSYVNGKRAWVEALNFDWMNGRKAMNRKWGLVDEAEASIPPKAQMSDAKVYTPGTYNFSLKAGEQTDHWIVFPEGRATDSDVTSHDNKFKLVFSDGDVVPGDAKSAPRKLYPKFKIVAVADQPTITMVVK